MRYIVCMLYGIGVILYWVAFGAELYFDFPVTSLIITGIGGVVVTVALLWLVYNELLKRKQTTK